MIACTICEVPCAVLLVTVLSLLTIGYQELLSLLAVNCEGGTAVVSYLIKCEILAWAVCVVCACACVCECMRACVSACV